MVIFGYFNSTKAIGTQIWKVAAWTFAVFGSCTGSQAAQIRKLNIHLEVRSICACVLAGANFSFQVGNIFRKVSNMVSVACVSVIVRGVGISTLRPIAWSGDEKFQVNCEGEFQSACIIHVT